MIETVGGSHSTPGGSTEVVFWNGFQWTPKINEARVYSYKDAIKCRMLRTKPCDIDIHPWDRYGN